MRASHGACARNELAEGDDDRQRHRERHADHEEGDIRQRADDRHHDYLGAEVHADPRPAPVENLGNPVAMVVADEREREAPQPHPVRHEQQRDDEHAQEVEEHGEEVAGEGRRPLAGPVEDRVPEPRHLVVERRQSRIVPP